MFIYFGWVFWYMAMQDYQSMMLPFLEMLSGGAECTLQDLIEALSIELELTQAERHEPLPSGNQEVMRDHVGRARTYLKKAQLLVAPRRAVFTIAERCQ